MKKSISVFFPAYNDEGTIAKLVLDALDVLPSITSDYEILIIDDCSPDNSGKIADELQKKYKKVRAIHHKKNQGAGGALLSGYKNSKKEYIFYTDGDAQFNIKEIKKLVKYIPKNDVVVGYRLKRADPFLRKVASKAYNLLILLLFGLKMKDIDCSFKLIKKSLIDQIDLKTKSGFIDGELMWKLKKIQKERGKKKFVEVPVIHYPRKVGKTQFFKFKFIYDMLLDTFKTRFNIK